MNEYIIGAYSAPCSSSFCLGSKSRTYNPQISLYLTQQTNVRERGKDLYPIDADRSICN